LKRVRGFTLIELAIAISILAMLAAFALPALIRTVTNARSRSMTQKLMADFVWARNSAATAANATSGTVATFTVNADCSWSTTVNGTANTAHSMDVTTLGQMAPGLTCSAGATLPVTFSFTPQGFVTPSSTLTYTTNSGQNWVFQVMTSGSMLLTNGAS